MRFTESRIGGPSLPVKFMAPSRRMARSAKDWQRACHSKKCFAFTGRLGYRWLSWGITSWMATSCWGR